MHKVEYLLIADANKGTSTKDALKHLLQSNVDISISASSESITYKQKLSFELDIVKGSVSLEAPSEIRAIYFDITLICNSNKDADIKQFIELLKAVRTVTDSVLLDRSSIQVLWNDLNEYYAKQAYPLISQTENLMRKLITKFMHINVGNAWFDERIPDDVQKTLNVSNKDTTYLHNVDFIRLKDILLSDRYAKDKDALIKKLKSSDQASFKREDIKSLIPTSNWEKYFSDQVNCSAEVLEGLWTKLYDLRCQVAHNKSFTKDDLKHTKEICEKLDTILNDAIGKLDAIHVDQGDAQEILEDAATSVSGIDSIYTVPFLRQWRRLSKATFRLTSSFQPTDKKRVRMFTRDVKLMLDHNIIDEKQYESIKNFYRSRNQLVHGTNVTEAPDVLNLQLDYIVKINDYLESIIKDDDSPSSP